MESNPERKEEFKFVIQEADQSNWATVRDLYLKLLQTDPDAFADTYEEVLPRTDEEWKRNIESGKTFIATSGTHSIGMGRVNFYDELPGVPVLHKLGVLPEYRGKGIATKIVKAREDWARDRGAKKVRLYVMADRKDTIEFSKKNGYEIIEEELDGSQHETSDSSTVIMEKKL